jgi:hypothetical protein
MLLDDMCDRLLKAASKKKWDSREEPAIVSRSFRGDPNDLAEKLPLHARGLRLGHYPVLACELELTSRETLNKTLRAAHNQMIVARSHLSGSEVIDAHIFFVAGEPSASADWEQEIDLIERNETVCRKLVWMPDRSDLAGSFEELIGRSFLAQPWDDVAARHDAPLDQNEEIVEQVLQEKGLSPAAASKWVAIAKTENQDPDAIVDLLVSIMEEA